MRATLVTLVAALAFAGCDTLTETTDEDGAVEYRGSVSGPLVETTVTTRTTAPNYTCTFTYNLSGPVWVRLSRSGDMNGANGGINITETGVSSGGGEFCGAAHPNRNTGDWRTDVTGSRSDLRFSIQRRDSNNSNFTADYAVSFAGSVVGNEVIGTVTYARTSTLLENQASTTATASVTKNVRLTIQ